MTELIYYSWQITKVYVIGRVFATNPSSSFWPIRLTTIAIQRSQKIVRRRFWRVGACRDRDPWTSLLVIGSFCTRRVSSLSCLSVRICTHRVSTDRLSTDWRGTEGATNAALVDSQSIKDVLKDPSRSDSLFSSSWSGEDIQLVCTVGLLRVLAISMSRDIKVSCI